MANATSNLPAEKIKVIQRALKQLKYRGGSEVLRAMLKYADKGAHKIDRKLVNEFIELCDERAANP